MLQASCRFTRQPAAFRFSATTIFQACRSGWRRTRLAVPIGICGSCTAAATSVSRFHHQ